MNAIIIKKSKVNEQSILHCNIMNKLIKNDYKRQREINTVES